MMRPPFVLSCKDAFFKRCQNILLDVTLGELQTLFFTGVFISNSSSRNRKTPSRFFNFF